MSRCTARVYQHELRDLRPSRAVPMSVLISDRVFQLLRERGIQLDQPMTVWNHVDGPEGAYILVEQDEV